MFALMFTATLVTAGLCLGLIPLARKIGLLDHPGGRKGHDDPTPLTGGPALLITSGLMMFFLANIVMTAVHKRTIEPAPQPSGIAPSITNA